MARPNEVLTAVARGEAVDVAEVDQPMFESAIEHRISGLLLESVRMSPDVQRATLLNLLSVEGAVARGQQSLTETLMEVDEILSKAGIIHTFIKGLTSAIRWFDKPTQRPFADVDIVVPPGEPIVMAARLLDEAHPMLPLLEAGVVSSIDILFNGVPIDLQTDALRTGLTPINPAWSEGSDRLDLGAGDSIRVFDPEHDLVIFLLHFERDRFRFLQGLAEAKSRLEHPIDWIRVEEIAREEGIWEQVAVALEVVCQELKIESPVRTPKGWRARFWRRMWPRNVRLLGEVTRTRFIVRAQFLMPLTMKGRSLDAILWMLGRAFPPDALLRFRYPTVRGPYLWRVFATRVMVRRRRRSKGSHLPN